MKIRTTIIFALLLVGCGKRPESDSDSFVRDVLKASGVQMQTSEKVSDKDAAKIIGALLPTEEWISINPSAAAPQDAKARLFDYGDRGKCLSLQKYFDPSAPSMINVTIQEESGIRLRHKIVVGTDLASWKLIRKETTWPKDNPFKRIYLFSRGDSDLRGLIFFEGAMVEIFRSGPVNNKTIDDVMAITWRTASRLEGIYQEVLKPISKGPLFKGNPVLTRPDLPDPDTNGQHN